MRRRGVEMKFVVNGDSKAFPRTDTVLLKLIARAHCWFDDLISGRAASMVEIAKREKVGKRYVSRVIRLAFLATRFEHRTAIQQVEVQLAADCRSLRARVHSQL